MRKRSGRNEGTTGGRLLAIRRSASGTTWRSTHGRCVLHLPPKGRDRRNGRVDRPQCLVLSHRCRRLARRPCCGDGRPPIAAPRRARCSGSASLPASPGVRRALEPRGPQLRRRRLRAHAGPRPSAREDRARVGDAQVRARPIGIPHTDAGESGSGSALRLGTPSVAGEGAARPKAHRADHSIHPPEPLPRRALQRHLEWEWSTHRDWVGGVARPCVDRARWASAMGKRLPSCIAWLHEYVSSDVSVPRARPLADPEPFLRPGVKDAAIDALLWSVPRALRSHRVLPHEFTLAERRLFLLSAARWTRYSGAELARHLGCHATSAQRTIRRQRQEDASGKEEDRTPRGADGPVRARYRVTNGSGNVDRPTLASDANRGDTVGSRQRRDVLSASELHAMALLLADRRLSTKVAPGAGPGG